MNRLTLVLCLAAVCPGASTKLWEQSSQTDFEKGTLTRLSLRSDGRLTLAPVFKELFDAGTNYLWAVVTDSKGNVYAAGSGQDSRGRVVVVDTSGRGKLLVELSGLEVHALAVDRQDRLYAATSPDGKVYRVDASGQAVVFYEPRAKYIWALAFDPAGNLLVATGDRGEVHRVTPSGAGTVWFKTEEAHARSMVVDKSGNAYVGTEPSGLVFRVSPQGQAFAVYQSSKREITALAIAPTGSLYAAAVGNRQAGGAAPAAAPPPPPTPGPAPAAGAARTPGAGAPAPVVMPIGSMGPSVQGGSEVVRIEPDGYARKLWTHSSEVAYALAFDSEGRALIGTGNKGNIYRLDSDLLFSLLVNASPTQVTGLYTGANGRIFAITGNIGKLYQLGPGTEKTGTFESEAMDAGFFAYWGRVRTSNAPANAPVKVETRSGNLETPHRNWSPWAEVSLKDAAGRIGSPPARFLQYRLTLATTQSGVVPSVSTVDIAYMPKNVAPVLEMIDLTPPNYKFPTAALSLTPSQNITLPTLSRTATRSSASSSVNDQPASSMSYAKGFVGARWLAHDDNGDPLISKVEIRGIKESGWKLLKDDVRERNLSWDSTAFPDGEYVLRVTVSDAPGNPPGAALTATLESDPFVVDNTPPRIQNLTAQRTGNRVEIRWHASDGLNVLSKGEYSIDGGEWKIVDPTTRLTDSPEHDYVCTIQDLPPGEHTIAVRETDEYDNVAVEKTVVR